MAEAILLTLRETWSGYVEGLRLVIPRLLVMLSVVLAGWLVAALARAVALRALGWLRLGRLAERTRAAELLRKAELPRPSGSRPRGCSGCCSSGSSWRGSTPSASTLASLQAEVLRLVPRLVGAVAILALGLVLANVVWRVVLLAAVNAGWPSARLIGRAAYVLTATIAVAMALDQAGLARPIVLAAFAIAFGALMLALAIAVGTGAGPIVRRLLEERLAARDRPPQNGGVPPVTGGSFLARLARSSSGRRAIGRRGRGSSG